MKRPRRKKGKVLAATPPGEALIQSHVSAQQAVNIDRFLEAFKLTGEITAAAHQAGVGRETHYWWMRNVDGYAQRFVDAHHESLEYLVREARRRALAGDEELVFSGGQQMFARDPETGALIRDAQGQPQPIIHKKKSDRLLVYLLDIGYGRVRKTFADVFFHHRHFFEQPGPPSARVAPDQPADGETNGAATAKPVQGKVIVIRLGAGQALRTMEAESNGQHTNGTGT